MTNLRTVLMWLDEQQIHPDAECWVLGHDTVQPVVDIVQAGGGEGTYFNTQAILGDLVLITTQPWGDPTPAPLHYGAVYDTILETYSGGGRLLWDAHHKDTYRGSYVVNAESAVFFLFLPTDIEIVDSHEEKMEQRKKQAIELTRKIEESQTWPTSM